MRRTLLAVALAAGVSAHAGTCQSVFGTAVARYMDDAALGKRWAVVIDCAHPGNPASLVPVSGIPGAQEAMPDWTSGLKRIPRPVDPPQVTAGMQVVLWSRERRAEMRLTGTALTAARTGETVRVRAGLKGSVLSGVVRGPASVEMVPGPPRWRDE